MKVKKIMPKKNLGNFVKNLSKDPLPCSCSKKTGKFLNCGNENLNKTQTFGTFQNQHELIFWQKITKKPSKMPKLSNVLNKVGKTINLAKPSSYQIPRKPPLNTLIFEKLPEPRCGDKITCGIKGPPITKPVRICTKEDMQSFYCPPPCDCKVKPQPLTFSQKLGFLFTQAMKGIFVGGLIYGTYKEGLWSSAFKSACLLGKFIESCPKEEDEDDVNEFLDFENVEIERPEDCQPYIPHASYILYKIGYTWNQVVIFLFWLVLEGPSEGLMGLISLFRKKPKPKEIPECPA